MLHLCIDAAELADTALDVAVVDGALALQTRHCRSQATPYGDVVTHTETSIEFPHDIHLPAGVDPRDVMVDRHGGNVDIRIPLQVVHRRSPLVR